MASSSVVGEKYSKLRGIIGRHLSYIGIDFSFKLSVSTVGRARSYEGNRVNVNMVQRSHEKEQKQKMNCFVLLCLFVAIIIGVEVNDGF